jgi:hypothetical protein
LMLLADLGDRFTFQEVLSQDRHFPAL